MLKPVHLICITILLVVASTAGGAYLWWQSTPQFALMEARNGYMNKNRKKFNKYVDVANLTTAFTEEIIFAPAERTKNLSKLQRIVGLGALHAARNKIDNSLIFQIQKLVNKPNPSATPSVATLAPHDDDDRDLAPSKVGAQPDHDCVAAHPGVEHEDAESGIAGGSASRKKILKPIRPFRFTAIVRNELKKEKDRLKRKTFERMAEFAFRHPDTLVNRIFAAPVGGRANAVKEILAECGFRGKNFKKYELEHRGTKCIAHLTFMSPRINDLVTIKLEMERLPNGPFGRYRISRLVDFKKTLYHLKYDTDEQIQGLVTYGLQDINGQTLASQAKEVVKTLSSTAKRIEDNDRDSDGVPDEFEQKSGTEIKSGKI